MAFKSTVPDADPVAAKERIAFSLRRFDESRIAISGLASLMECDTEAAAARRVLVLEETFTEDEVAEAVAKWDDRRYPKGQR